MDRHMSAALDKHITGNYGMDQFRDEEQFMDLCDFACANCFMAILDQCHGELCEQGLCLVVQDVIRKEEEVQNLADDVMHEQWMEEPPSKEEARLCQEAEEDGCFGHDGMRRDSAEIDHDDPINQG
jgi:hypothetical protein